MAGDVLETDSMQQTEDETRKAHWASRMMDGGRWLPLRLGGVARRGTRKGCVSKQPSPRAHHDPTQAQQSSHRHRHRRRAVLVARLSRWQRVYRSTGVERLAANGRPCAWGNGADIQQFACEVGMMMEGNAPRVHASSALGARVQWLAF
jgi:hypothetical protein